MPVESVTATATAAATTATGTAAPPKKALDAEVFLQLLVAQMKNQDPSSPLDTNEMMAQTTQLAMMEQLTALADTFTESFALSMRQTAASLVGTQASYVDADGVTQTGLVTKVSFENSIPLVTIGDATVPLDAVSGITAS
jgi:flagellar basal-body rod modification protein FlgD